MAKGYYQSYRKKSRYLRSEERKSLQQTAFFLILTLILILLAIFLGVPLFIKGAIFLGNLKSKGEIVERTDRLPLPPPVLKQTYIATSSAQINVSGYGQEGKIIWLFLNDRKIKEVMVDKTGEFAISDVVLSKGKNEIKALARDEKDGESKYSEIYEVVFDNEPPTLEIFEPTSGAGFYGEDKEAIIKGKTDDGSVKITVNDRMVIVDPTGNFSYVYQLSEGENKIKVVAQDEAGNQAETEIILNYRP